MDWTIASTADDCWTQQPSEKTISAEMLLGIPPVSPRYTNTRKWMDGDNGLIENVKRAAHSSLHVSYIE